MTLKVKDVYDKVQSGEVSRYKFMEWLGMYGFGYKNKGFNQGWKACEEERMMLQKPLTNAEIKELINDFPIIFSPQDLLAFAKAIEERHGIK